MKRDDKNDRNERNERDERVAITPESHAFIKKLKDGGLAFIDLHIEEKFPEGAIDESTHSYDDINEYHMVKRMYKKRVREFL